MADAIADLIDAARAWRKLVDAETMGQWADEQDFALVAAVDQLDTDRPALEYAATRCPRCLYIGPADEHYDFCAGDPVPVRILIVAGAGDG
jgi:hypothetical protein